MQQAVGGESQSTSGNDLTPPSSPREGSHNLHPVDPNSLGLSSSTLAVSDLLRHNDRPWTHFRNHRQRDGDNDGKQAADGSQAPSAPVAAEHSANPEILTSVSSSRWGIDTSRVADVVRESRLRRSAKRPPRQEKSDLAMPQPGPLKKARTGRSPSRDTDTPSVNKPCLVEADPRYTESRHTPTMHSSTGKHIARASGFATEANAGALSGLDSTTTLKLPRARVSSSSPALTSSTPGSYGSSMEISAPSLSSDGRSLPQNLPGLTGVGVLDFVEQDERPTFLVDLASAANASMTRLRIVYCNAVLRASPALFGHLAVERDDTEVDAEYGGFMTWVLSKPRSSEGRAATVSSHSYHGLEWTAMTLRRRFRFVSGRTGPARAGSELPNSEPDPNPSASEDLPMAEHGGEAASPVVPVTPEPELSDVVDYFESLPAPQDPVPDDIMVERNFSSGTDAGLAHPDEFTNQVLQAQPTRSTFDWTRMPISDDLPDHIKFCRSVDWAATALGPIEDWAPELRAMSNLIMGSPHPAAIYWGPQFTCIYNAAYIDLAGEKHPSLMGSTYPVGWAEIWPEIQPIFKSAWDSGQAMMKNEHQLFIYRHGFLEETFFSWSIVPIVGSDGDVVGIYNPAFESTKRRVNERRMLALREVGEKTASATSTAGFWAQVEKGLEYDEFEVPFALIYSVKEDLESEVSSLHSGSLAHPQQLLLVGSIGVPEDHALATSNIDLRTSEEGFAPYVREAMTKGGAPVVLSAELQTLPTHLLEGLQWKGFGDPCTTLIILPVTPVTPGESVVGFIVMGINPRRRFDQDYELFIHILSRQLATSMASVVLIEEERKRGQKAAKLAALDRQELSTQLLLRTQEASESEYKFSRMAEFAPVGMFIADARGLINYCNDMWWQISRHSRSVGSENNWMESVQPEDRPRLEASWQLLLEEKTTISEEFRFKYSQRNGDSDMDTWVLMSAFPEKNLDGSLKSIFGCITDISSQKLAEKVQNERREEAVELKRQQENFIDITSHEMRNPLSAILQCADQIANSIGQFASHHIRDEVETLLEGCLDAANTINLCASHQKRIVDDILTLSKLDSNLLAVTPVDEQPVRVIQRALKMFESELIAHDIEFEFIVDKSFDQLGIKWAKLDPSRLRQVLINFMTNAIKFTQGRETRHIRVCLSASRDTSEVTSKGMFFFGAIDHRRTPSIDVNNSEEWGHGERFSIHCSVEDSGPGLGEEEMKLLFQRFQQVSPRTHVQYGGSGLGLYISRILTEMQGGQIGVSSEEGSGSKFTFYIQSRRSLHPPADYERISPFKIARKPQSQVAGASQVTQTEAEPSPRSAYGTAGNPLFDVLIVEDNVVNQKVLQRQLHSCGNNTFVANHGMEALQTLQRSRFWAGKEAEGLDISVILMDLEMPVMDGMTCARRIRELEQEGMLVRHIPIIAVTAYARPEQIRSAKAAGIDDVISKPFRIPELLPKIEELVTKYRGLSMSTTT